MSLLAAATGVCIQCRCWGHSSRRFVLNDACTSVWKPFYGGVIRLQNVMCVNGFMTVSYYVLIARLTLTGSVACSCYQHGTLLSPPIGVERKPRASFPWQDRVIGSAFLVVTSYYSIKLIEIPRLHRESGLLDVQWMWIGTAALSIQRDTGTIVDPLVPVHRILFSCLVPGQAIERIKVYKASSAVRRTCVNFTLRRVYFVPYKLWTAVTADTNTVFFSFPESWLNDKMSQVASLLLTTQFMETFACCELMSDFVSTCLTRRAVF